MANAADFLDQARSRLSNPAVSDIELLQYIEDAMLDVKEVYYSPDDYIAQILDTVCQELAIDGKFPEINSINGGGVSTAFNSNDPERYRRRLAGRRQAAFMGQWC